MKAAAEADLQQLQHNATLIQSLQVNMHAPRKDFSGREGLLWNSLKRRGRVLLSRRSKRPLVSCFLSMRMHRTREEHLSIWVHARGADVHCD